ncbi:MAG TPA: type II toxin-antitoxin system VapC family toxin [Terriglobales bacterium]|nr:type II toxin-antitoxin system VapC family toxin [Terriglobales bacterium]
MILIDANLLIYAHDTRSPLHDATCSWFNRVLAESRPVGLAWATLLAFLRITTSSRALSSPLLPAEAVAVIDDLLQRPPVVLLQPSERHWPILQRCLTDGQAAGDLITDAHLAALAIEHGAVLCTTDRDFARFPGLRWENPLEQR